MNCHQLVVCADGKLSNVAVMPVLYVSDITTWHQCPGMLQQQEKILLNSNCCLLFPGLQVFGLES